jgi:hypothetical protein
MGMMNSSLITRLKPKESNKKRRRRKGKKDKNSNLFSHNAKLLHFFCHQKRQG